jgi:hypothetical protein
MEALRLLLDMKIDPNFLDLSKITTLLSDKTIIQDLLADGWKTYDHDFIRNTLYSTRIRPDNIEAIIQNIRWLLLNGFDCEPIDELYIVPTHSDDWRRTIKQMASSRNWTSSMNAIDYFFILQIGISLMNRKLSMNLLKNLFMMLLTMDTKSVHLPRHS